jgi:MFS family permease
MAQAQIAVAQPPTVKKQATLGLIAVFAAYFASSYFFRASGITLPKIAADLNGMHLFSWAISLPALASAFVTLTFGKLSDMYGRRIMLIVALCLYMGGAIFAALCQSFLFFIAARIIIALGQGAIPPLCFSVIGDLYPPAERSKWSGFLQIPAGIAAMVVPTSVGMLTDSLSWRYFLWIAVLLVMIGGTFVLIGIPALSKKTEHTIDFSGSCLLALSSSTMILAFSWAGSVYVWASPQIIGLLSASVLSWAVFLWIEGKADEPMLDLQVLTNKTFLIAAVAALISYFSCLGVLMYFPLFLQGVQHTSATLSGKIITPFSMLMSFTGVPAGYLLSRTKRYKPMYIVGYGIHTIAAFCMVGDFSYLRCRPWTGRNPDHEHARSPVRPPQKAIRICGGRDVFLCVHGRSHRPGYSGIGYESGVWQDSSAIAANRAEPD